MDSQTVLHPIGLMAVILLGIATLMVPRRYAIVPILIVACFISPGQRIMAVTLDFNLLRVMILFGWIRIFMTGEASGFRWKSLDLLVILWTLAGTAILTLREGTLGSLIYRFGLMYDACGMYFLFRFLVRSWSDVEMILTAAALISIPVAAFFLLEQATGRNVFAIFGGVSEITVVRDGRLRCRGPFAHPIYAGCFWAALMPMIGALWFTSRPKRWLAPIGLFASMVVIITTSSATPISAMMVAIAGAALYPLRRYLSWMRWLAVFGLVSLHLVMIQPVWHMLARIQLVGGTGWYRYKLIDEFINRFNEWWLLGTSDYQQWWEYGFEAVTNQYVLEGVQGGLLTLALFIGVIVCAFHGVGRIIRSFTGEHFPRCAAWAMGASLVVHCAAFIGVSYFGQIYVVWYLGLSIVGSMLPEPRDATRRVYRIVHAQDERFDAQSELAAVGAQ